MNDNKDFDAWNSLKKQLHAEELKTFYDEREIWFCSLGVNIGFEQDGKNKNFERPVLVLRKFNRFVFWGVPLSTQMKPDNTHYLPLKHKDLDFSAIVSQLRLYDARRLTRRLYELSRPQFRVVRARVIDEICSKKSKSALQRKSRSPEAPDFSKAKAIVFATIDKKSKEVKQS